MIRLKTFLTRWFSKKISTDCGAMVAAKHGTRRSSKWPKVAKKFLKKNPACAICGSISNVQVHHIINFEIVISLGRPDLELDERNLIQLCQSEDGKEENNCHLKYGHSGSFFRFNPNIREDVERYKGIPYASLNEDGKKDVRNGSLPSFDKMTPEQIDFVKSLIEKLYP